MRTLKDLFEICAGKELWVYLKDEETHKEFETQLFELAKEIDIYDSLKSRINAYPISDEVAFKYHHLLNYFNLGGKSICHYEQCGPTAFPFVLYVDFKKYINGYEYPDYVMKEQQYESSYKNVTIKINNSLYRLILDTCIKKQTEIEDEILKVLSTNFEYQKQ